MVKNLIYTYVWIHMSNTVAIHALESCEMMTGISKGEEFKVWKPIPKV